MYIDKGFNCYIYIYQIYLRYIDQQNKEKESD